MVEQRTQPIKERNWSWGGIGGSLQEEDGAKVLAPNKRAQTSDQA